MGSSLWSDKYTPRTEVFGTNVIRCIGWIVYLPANLQQDLAITPAKVKSVRTWINDSLATGTQNGNKVIVPAVGISMKFRY
jgi:hypothetical protein